MSSDKQKLPNIIFIVMDTVGAKHMSLYGYPRSTTPNLDRIAEECQVYTRCFAPSSWTIPSHASMFTGLYPSQHGAHEGNLTLSENFQHLVPVLKMAGYRTLGISSNPLVCPASGICRGFDTFTGFGKPKGFGAFVPIFNPSIKNLEQRISYKIHKVGTHWERIKMIFNYFRDTGNYREGFYDLAQIAKHLLSHVINPSPFQKSSKYTRKSLNLFQSLLKEHFSSANCQPFFIFINFIEAHELYKPPLTMRRFSQWYNKQYRRVPSLYNSNLKFNKTKTNDMHINLYDDEILFQDYAISQLWETLKQYPSFNNTVFIVTSDHGEHFGEKGRYGHTFSLYNESLRVPLLIKFPEASRNIGVSDELVSLVDLYATILDFADTPLPRPRTSFSLLNGAKRDFALAQLVNPYFWTAQIKLKEESCRAEGQDFFPPRFAAITSGGKKIIENTDGGLEVYDLTKDPHETNNLSSTISDEIKGNLVTLLTYLKSETAYLEAVKNVDLKKSVHNVVNIM